MSMPTKYDEYLIKCRNLSVKHTTCVRKGKDNLNLNHSFVDFLDQIV